MAVQAEGCWSLAIENLRRLVAACPGWQQWTNATGPGAAEKAAAKLYLVDLPPVADNPDSAYSVELLTELRPFGIIDTMAVGSNAFAMRKVGESVFVQSGTLFVSIEDNIIDADLVDPASAKVRFLNRIGRLIEDITQIAGTDDHLNVLAVTAIGDVERTPEDAVVDIGERYVAFLQITYGV